MTCFCVRPLDGGSRRNENHAGKTQLHTPAMTCKKAWSSLHGRSALPEPEGGAPCEEHRLGLGLGLLQKPEEGVVLHTYLPKGLTAIPAQHQELQHVLACAAL